MKREPAAAHKLPLTSFISRHIVLYLIMFFGILGLFISSFVVFEQFYIVAFLKPVALAAYYILKALGIPITFDPEPLPLGYCDYILPAQVLRVNFGCTGIYVLFIYLSAVLAYPAKIKAKLLGVGMGIPLFALYSIFRLAVMGVTGFIIFEYLSLVHSYLMVIINIAFIIWLYSYWIQHAAQGTKE